MKKPLERVIGPCVLCGRMFFAQIKTRPPKYCWECAREARRMNNRDRQRAFRQRQRDAQAQPAKQPDGGSPRPALIGERASVARTTERSPRVGLYSHLPEPDRTTKRKGIGLP